MKVKVKCFKNQYLPEQIDKGDWVDLRTNEEVHLNGPYANILSKNRKQRDVVFENQLIHIGIAMQLPKGYEVVVLPRSSTFNKYGVILANSQGVIDNTYCGDDDEWLFHAIALRKCDIQCYDRIAQFKIQLSQFATPWQKIKWLFTRKIQFVKVNSLDNENRGGIGSTGYK